MPLSKKPLQPVIVELWTRCLKVVLDQLDKVRADQIFIRESGKPHDRWEPVAEDVSWHSAYQLSAKKALALHAPKVLTGIALGSIIMPDKIPEEFSAPQKKVLKLTMPALMIFEGNIQSLAATSSNLHSLVASVAQGNDEAYFSALKADPATLRCTPLQKRYQKALSSFDRAFIQKTGRNLAHKPVSEEQRDLGRLRLVCWLMNQAEQLDRLTMKSASHLFIDELKLYPQSGRDPEASLWAEIKRTKERLDNN